MIEAITKISKGARSFLFALILTFPVLPVFSQDMQKEIPIHGAVTAEASGKNMGDVSVVIYEDGSRKNEVITSNSGKYETKLKFGHKYTIEFQKQGYATKKLQIDTRNVTEKAREEGGFQMEVGMTLFKKMEEMDESVLDQPIGKASFQSKKSAIDWDYQYTAKVKQKIENEKKRARRAMEKKKERQEKYNELVAEGDKQMNDESYKEAKESYDAALQIFSDKTEIKNKLEKAKKLAAKKEKQEKYDKLIEEADDAFDDEEYENAEGKYKEALAVFPNKTHPKSRIGKIKNILKNKKKYEKLISEADALFDNKSLEKAKGKYNEALGLFPDKDHPSDRVEEIDEILAERKEKQKEYDQLISKADEQMGKEEYEEAKENYSDASEIFPKKEYPQKKITEIEELIAKQQEQQEKYDRLISEGDDLFGDEKYTDAKSKYQQALNIYSDKEHPKSRLSEIEKLVGKQQQYDQLISDADGLYDQEKYQEAKPKYKEALKLFPDEDHPQNRVKEIESLLAEQKKKQENYDNLISQADNLFDQENYQDARNKYKEALDIFPDESHPQNRVDKIDELLSEKQEKKQRYEQLISEADQKYNSKEYEAARSKYKEALKVYADKQHPKDRVKEIDNLLSQKKEKQSKYDQLISSADQLFQEEKYQEAKGKYKEALQVFPNKEHPKNRVEEIDKLFAEQKQKQKKYDQLISEGDEHFSEESYEKARTKYQSALDVFSGKDHPTQRLKEIEGILAKKREKMNKYDQTVSKADQFYSQKDYQKALSKYEEAAKLKPEENHPKSRIEEINQLLKKQKEKQEKYDKLVKRGDVLFEQENLEEAKGKYKEALGVFSDKEHPQKRIEEIDEKLAAKSEKKEQFSELVQTADGLFDKEEYSSAKSKYEDALQIKPDASHPKSRVREIEQILAQQKKKEQEFNNLVEEGDKLFGKEEYQQAKEKYDQALDIKSGAKHPKEQIQKIKNLLADQEEKEQRYNNLISKADRSFNASDYKTATKKYEEALQIKPDAKHPQDRIDEIERILAEQKKKEKEEKASEYRQLVGKADDAFSNENYGDARSLYNRALQIKPDESHPQDRLDKIKELLAQKEEEKATEPSSSSQDEGDDKDARYDKLISLANQQFNNSNYKEAKRKYQDALQLKPSEYHPKRRIKQIEDRLKEQSEKRTSHEQTPERSSSENEQKRKTESLNRGGRNFAGEKTHTSEEQAEEMMAEMLEEESQEKYKVIKNKKRRVKKNDREEQQQNEQSRKASKESLDELREKQKKEQQDQEKKLANDVEDVEAWKATVKERKQDRREESKTSQEVEQKYIEVQKKKERERFEKKDEEVRQEKVENVRDFQEKVKEQEQERTEENATSREVEQKYIEVQKKKEGERFDKKDELRKLRQEEIAGIEKKTRNAKQEREKEDRTSREVEHKYVENIKEKERNRFEEKDELREENTEELEEFQEEVNSRKKELERENKTSREVEKKYLENLKKKKKNFNKKVDKIHEEVSKDVMEKKEKTSNRRKKRAEEAETSREVEQKYHETIKEKQTKFHEERKGMNDDKHEEIKTKKKELKDQDATYQERSEEERKEEREERTSKKDFSEPKDYDEYHQSKLAKEHPEGVTEEQYKQNNKVIIRRIVVRGNKADDYHKTIAKWGTSYFKNGKSISKSVWENETEEEKD